MNNRTINQLNHYHRCLAQVKKMERAGQQDTSAGQLAYVQQYKAWQQLMTPGEGCDPGYSAANLYKRDATPPIEYPMGP